MNSSPNNDNANNNAHPQQDGQITYWYNGQSILGDTITLPISDPGLIYGATLFTTLRVHHHLDHPATQWQAHCDRLRHATQQLNFTAPNWDHIRAGAEYIYGHYPVVRIVIFPNGIEWITGRSLPPDLAERQTKGITAWVAPPDYQRSLPQYKSSNYLAPWLAAREGREHQAAETILTNSKGHWLETATGNLWGYRDGKWWIPPLLAPNTYKGLEDQGVERGIGSDRPINQRLPGTGQKFLTRLLENDGQAVTPCPWTADWITELEAIAYSNSGVGLIPIRTVLDSEGKILWQTCESKAADHLLHLWQRAIH